MPTLLLLVWLGQVAPAPHPRAVASCDLTAVPVVCDVPAFAEIDPASADPFCRGPFLESCSAYALAECDLTVENAVASIEGAAAVCSVDCASAGAAPSVKTCRLGSTAVGPGAAGPLCVEGAPSARCRLGAISDDPDPIADSAQGGKRLGSPLVPVGRAAE